MEECEFCDEEFEDKIDLHIHWGNEHEEKMNSHQREKVKKAEKKKKEQEKKERERKKDLAFKVLVSGLALVLAAVLIPQMLSSVSEDGTSNVASFSLENEPMLGQDSANVTIVEFGDFYCPACQTFASTVKPRLESEYIETGQAKMHYMQFPLDIHNPEATRAAVASECVYNQDEEAFWNYHDALFENQRQISYDTPGLMALARSSTEGLDYEELEKCIRSQETSGEVNGDLQEGLSSEVTGTPTIYVNGKKADDFSYQTISSMIEGELSN